MEHGWNLFNYNNNNNSIGGTTGSSSSTSTTTTLTSGRGQISTFPNPPWDAPSSASSSLAASTPSLPDARGIHALVFPDPHHHSPLYAGGGGGGSTQHHHRQQQQQNNPYPDPHLTCLKLGKRQYYFEDHAAADGLISSCSKRGKPSMMTMMHPPPPPPNPRCQVEGCEVGLEKAKEYHRRHKVCEMHSKAPKVVLLGILQRFCQQCSRFHAVSEFDESKRSCRRRLAGHNQRRRKSSSSNSINTTTNAAATTNCGHDYHSITSNHPNSQGRAFSLLSSKNSCWASSADLSSRCSAALRELIAENRAAILARQLILDRDGNWYCHATEDNSNHPQLLSSSPNQHQQVFPDQHSWDRYNEGDTHLTLDLMQAPSSAFELLSMRGKSKEEEEEDECSELWSSFGGSL